MSPALPRRGPFELLAPLGRGGMARVWLARVCEGPQAGQAVALKVLPDERVHDAEAREALLQEAELARLLVHPRLVRFVAYHPDEAGGALALELVEGCDLGWLLERCRQRRIRLPPDVCLLVVRGVLEALAHAHAACSPAGRPLGLVHCDISPSNVLLSREGEVKLADFGVACARGWPTLAAHRLGKQHYRSPELLEGVVAPEVDLWASAVLLYEMLSLELPFAGKSPEDVARAIRERRFPPLRTHLPGASEGLERLLERALSPAPAQRFPAAEAFARAVGGLLDARVGTPLALAAVVRGLQATGEEPPRASAGARATPPPGLR